MNRKLNLANVILSVLIGLTLLFSAVQPVSVSALNEDNAFDLALSQVSERDSVDENIAILPALVVIPTDIDRFVSSTTGVDSGDCKDKNSPCLTIAYAISQMADGDVIGAEQGLYNESVVFPYGCNKSVTLSGGWNGTFDAQGGYSTIDGEKIRQGLSVGDYCTVSVDHLNIQNGYGYSDGGGISNSGNLTISTSIIQNNNANQYGGGIYNDGSLLILYSAISNNTAKVGGGGVAGFFTAQNTTIARNMAAKGGAIHHFGNSNTTLNNVTFIENQATSEGGALYNTDTGTSVRLKNSILVSGLAGACAYYPGSKAFVSLGHNLFNRKCTITLDPTDFNVIDPRIGGFLPSLGYAPLLADSPAVNSGGVCAGNIDQRGQSRIGVCDIGAFEYVAPGAAASLAEVSGDKQTANPNKDFPRPLVAVALDSGGNPVPGTQVTFDAPSSGATATFVGTGTHSQTVTTNVYGQATISQLTANSEYGPFNVQVSIASAPLLTFSLENLMWTVSPTGSDLNTCKTPLDPCQTIPGAISKAPVGDTVFVAEGVYAATSGDQVILINKAINLSGGWNSDFTSRSGYSTIDGNNVRRGVTVDVQFSNLMVSIDGFLITNGKNSGIRNGGGGIYIFKNNKLTLSNSVVSNNIAVNGGGIYAEAETNLTIENSVIKNNHATVSSTAGDGGGISFEGVLKISNSAIFENEARVNGGGIKSSGYDTSGSIMNSTIVNNYAGDAGGAIHRTVNSPSGLTLNNVTITENSAKDGGGLSGSVQFQNSIIANNHAEEEQHGNCDGLDQTSLGFNIIYPYCPFAFVSGSFYLIQDPKLGAFLPDEGYVPLMPGSPAINSGNPATPGSSGQACLTSDQRGLARPEGFFCDMGAVEVVLYPAPLFKATSRGTYDGWVLESTETSNGGGSMSTSGTLKVGDDDFDKQYRSLLYFNTSDLPEDAVIIKVTLKIKKQGVKGTIPFTTHGNLLVDLRKGAFGGAKLEKTDFQAAATRSNLGNIQAVAGMPNWYQTKLGSIYVRLNINLAGVTQFRLHFTKDDNDDRGADFVQFYSGDTSVVEADRPVLIIEYMVP